MKVKRFDLGSLPSFTVTDAGFVKVPAYATRVGVFKYRRPDGSILRELRPADEVFNGDSMKSLEGVPLTNDHPFVMLTPENAKQFTVGFTGDRAEREGDFLRIPVTILDAETISRAKAGIREVSCGYLCELEESPGTFDGEPYDVIQRNIRYNHLALVDQGRAGPDARLRMDSADAIQEHERKNMKKITIDGKEFEVADEVAAAFDSMTAKVTELTDKCGGLEKNKDEVQAKADASDAEVKRLGAEIENIKKAHTDGLNDAVKARVAVVTAATPILKDQNFDAMTDLEIKRAVVKADCGQDFADKSDDYVAARFDMVVEARKKAGTKFDALGNEITENRNTDGQVTDVVAKAKQKAMDEARKAWEPKTV